MGARMLTVLGTRLRSRGGAFLPLAAAILLAAALVVLFLRPPGLAPWRVALALVALAAFLPQCYALADFDALLARRRVALRHVAINGLLLLLVGALVPIPTLTFVIFMLTTQAATALRLAPALAYAVALSGGWLAVLLAGGATPADLADVVAHNSLGAVFSFVSGVIIGRYVEQKVRAETLLGELTVAHAELAAAHAREQEVADAEARVRLAHELHDGLGHHLTLLSIQLQGAAKQVGRDPARAVATIDHCREAARAALEEVRRSVALMRDPLPHDRPLAEALVALVEGFARRTGLEAHFAGPPGPVTLPAATTLALYRAAQEGLTNACKHAAPRRVRVTLALGPDEVCLRVWNDGGTGATPPERPGGGGFGLAGLRERAAQLGGAFVATPDADGGFTLELRVPLRQEMPHAQLAGASR